MTKHISNLHDEYILQICPICDDTFEREYHLKKHLKRVHEGEMPAKDEKKLQCAKCDMKFKKKINLAHHFATYHIQNTGSLATPSFRTTDTPTDFSSVQGNLLRGIGNKTIEDRELNLFTYFHTVFKTTYLIFHDCSKVLYCNIEIHYESMSDKTKLLPKGLFNPLCLAPNHMSIRMSH